jgi:hypothetical protein
MAKTEEVKSVLMVVEGDTNDGDYIQESTEFTEQEWLDKQPLFGRVFDYLRESTEWCTGENCDEDEHPVYSDVESKLTQEEVDQFSEYVPHGEYGIHSISSVKIYHFTTKEEVI